MSTLTKRIEMLEQTPEAQRARRIAYAMQSGDWSGVPDDDLDFALSQHFAKLTLAEMQFVQGLGLSESDVRAFEQGNVRAVSDAGLNIFIEAVEAERRALEQAIQEQATQ